MSSIDLIFPVRPSSGKIFVSKRKRTDKNLDINYDDDEKWKNNGSELSLEEAGKE